MVKRALLIGVNYKGLNCELRGCKNDSEDIYDVLVQHLGYSAENTTLMTEDELVPPSLKPIRQNIINALNREIEQLGQGDHFLFSYSGHGSQLRCKEGTYEPQNMDSTMVPLDYVTNGEITDQELRQIFSKAPTGSTIFVLADCCHSGTLLDLRYTVDVEHISKLFRTVQKTTIVTDIHYEETNADILILSGCQDNDTSEDTIENNKPCGAMTFGFLEVLKKHNYNVTVQQLLVDVRALLKQHGYGQIPQMQAGRMVKMDQIVTI